MNEPAVSVIGAGLAGCEAAWQLAIRGVEVKLFEMKPLEMSPAHSSPNFAELVCSNSLRGAALTTAPGLLKEEMRRLGSLVIQAADATQIPAGGALAVDREGFSRYITSRIKGHGRIEIVTQRVSRIPQGHVIVASGPLTDGPLAEDISTALGGAPLHFFDAAAPIISAESIDMEKAYFASRYDKGTADYINCPMDRDEYTAFVRELASAQEAEVHGFEDASVFEGCMPVEVMARRGEDTLRFGPMKPVGLKDPRTGKGAWATVQLRADNEEKTMYNMVGFQTHLKQGEQRRVLRMIPGLEKAEFLRYGVMHRNSYINSPGKLDRFFRLMGRENIFFAGQITGVEGYIESAASGMLAGANMAKSLMGRPLAEFSSKTALGGLSLHISGYAGRNFQPMNINFGLIDAPGQRIKDKRLRYDAVSARALEEIEAQKGHFNGDLL